MIVISRCTLQNHFILTTLTKQRFPAEVKGMDLKNYFNLHIGPCWKLISLLSSIGWKEVGSGPRYPDTHFELLDGPHWLHVFWRSVQTWQGCEDIVPSDWHERTLCCVVCCVCVGVRSPARHDKQSQRQTKMLSRPQLLWRFWTRPAANRCRKMSVFPPQRLQWSFP